MLNYLKLEYLKFYKNPVVRLLTVFFVIFYPLGYLFGKEIKENLPDFMINKNVFFEFPTVWDYMGYGGSYLVFFFLGVISIYLTGLEVRYKTMRQSIINGMNMNQFFMSKIYNILFFSLFATLYYIIICVIIGFIHTENPMQVIDQNLIAIPKYFLMTLGYLSFGTMLVFLIKRSGLAIFVYFSYIMIIEPLIRWSVHFKIAESKWVNYYPMNAIEDLMPNPIWGFAEALPKQGLSFDFVLSSNESIILSCIYIALFIFFSYYSFQKRDI